MQNTYLLCLGNDSLILHLTIVNLIRALCIDDVKRRDRGTKEEKLDSFRQLEQCEAVTRLHRHSYVCDKIIRILEHCDDGACAER